jgi:predicted Ser/Thr protein kinase
MGRVVLARDRRLDRKVAIKLIQLTAEPGARARFLREAKALAAIQHPHVLAVYGYGESSEGPYLVTEFLEGGSLDRLPPGADPSAPLLQVAEGLDAVHAAGLLHRDVKPANMALAADGRCVLIDFGLARFEDATRMTRTGGIVGTLSYLAPELLREEPATPASDWYSWGVSLFQLLEGRSPFSSPQLLRMASGAVEIRPEFQRLAPDSPAAELLTQLLSPEPEERPSTGAEIRRRLAGVEIRITERVEPGGDQFDEETLLQGLEERSALPEATGTETAPLVLASGESSKETAPSSTPSTLLGSSGAMVVGATLGPLGLGVVAHLAGLTASDFTPGAIRVVLAYAVLGEVTYWAVDRLRRAGAPGLVPLAGGLLALAPAGPVLALILDGTAGFIQALREWGPPVAVISSALWVGARSLTAATRDHPPGSGAARAASLGAGSGVVGTVLGLLSGVVLYGLVRRSGLLQPLRWFYTWLVPWFRTGAYFELEAAIMLSLCLPASVFLGFQLRRLLPEESLTAILFAAAYPTFFPPALGLLTFVYMYFTAKGYGRFDHFLVAAAAVAGILATFVHTGATVVGCLFARMRHRA